MIATEGYGMAVMARSAHPSGLSSNDLRHELRGLSLIRKRLKIVLFDRGLIVLGRSAPDGSLS